jgi:hypothetical protein
MPKAKNRYSAAAKSAAEKTNAELSEELSSLAALTAKQIEEIAPRKQDKEQLARLLEIVGTATKENRAVASLTDNIEELGTVAVRVLRLLLV